MKQTALIISFFLGGAIFFLNKGAMQGGWYTAMPWFDVPMHFFGGMFVLFAIVGFFFPFSAPAEAPLRTAVFMLALVLSVGLLWEAFEYYVVFQYLGGDRPGTGIDVAADLLFDLLGGAAGWYFVSLKKKTYNRITNDR